MTQKQKFLQSPKPPKNLGINQPMFPFWRSPPSFPGKQRTSPSLTKTPKTTPSIFPPKSNPPAKEAATRSTRKLNVSGERTLNCQKCPKKKVEGWTKKGISLSPNINIRPGILFKIPLFRESKNFLLTFSLEKGTHHWGERGKKTRHH